MSLDDITEINSDSSGDGSDESIDTSELRKRVEDLEVEVYGHDRTTELSAGDHATITVKRVVVFLEKLRSHTDPDDIPGAATGEIHDVAEALGLDHTVSEQALEKLRRRGEVYEAQSGVVRAV
ncbi:hypothetical protein [Halococcus sp. AFM35]|uniref:hypothetical protein n=1 Tax=Halococcus sp. AFM35 TaxID=3421653 RepID=UPI003EBEBF2E